MVLDEETRPYKPFDGEPLSDQSQAQLLHLAFPSMQINVKIGRGKIALEGPDELPRDDPIFHEIQLFLEALIAQRRELFREVTQAENWDQLEAMFDMWSLAKGE